MKLTLTFWFNSPSLATQSTNLVSMDAFAWAIKWSSCVNKTAVSVDSDLLPVSNIVAELLQSAQADHPLAAFSTANGSSNPTGVAHGVCLCSSSSLTAPQSSVKEQGESQVEVDRSDFPCQRKEMFGKHSALLSDWHMQCGEHPTAVTIEKTNRQEALQAKGP